MIILVRVSDYADNFNLLFDTIVSTLQVYNLKEVHNCQNRSVQQPSSHIIRGSPTASPGRYSILHWCWKWHQRR